MRPLNVPVYPIIDSLEILLYNEWHPKKEGDMPYRRTSQWIVVIVSTLITLFCLYVLLISTRSGDMKSAWIFAAFGFLFATPLFVTIFHFFADRSPTLARIHKEHISLGQKHKTTFIPHWFVMTGVILIGLIILYTIIKWLFIYFGR
jgi:hypothetical protein